jgi:CRISPR/Cas system-associated exonuclease Cas4 (RecB family)
MLHSMAIHIHLTKFIYPEDFESKNNGIEFTEDEINSTVENFKQAVKSIKSYDFEPSYKENACKYCAYKDFCGMNKL